MRRLAQAPVIFLLSLSALICPAATQNFDEWSDATDPALVHTNAEGWVLHKAVASVGGRWFPYPHSSPRAAWLSDFSFTTNSWLRSPWLEYGAGSIGYYVSTKGTGVNHFEVQYSANGVDWQTIVSDSHSGPWGEWSSCSPEFQTGTPGYVRFVKTGQDGSPDTRLGLDDVVIEEPVYTFDPRQHWPCSRRTALAITEIMYHPSEGSQLEFIEIFNTDPVEYDIYGYRLSGEVDFTFPTNLMLAATNYLIVAADPAALLTANPGLDPECVFGPYSGALGNGGGTIRLRNREDAAVLEIDYNDNWPWPTQADGAGHSLVLTRPDYGENDRRAWAASSFVGGSPTHSEVARDDALARVVVNELLTHTDGISDYVELYNAGTQACELGGCALADNLGGNTFAIPPATVLEPNEFVAFDTNALGFALSMAGGDIYFIAPDGSRVIDAVRYPAQVNGVSSGRYPDGAPAFRVLASPTPAGANTGLFQQDIVINEIMYHSLWGDNDDEYIELYNRTTGTVDVGHWRLTDGIGFTFAAGTTIGPTNYLVVARDAARLIARYPQLDAANCVGNFGGRLSDRGERIVLSRPDDIALPDRDFVVVDTVEYGDGDGWGKWTDGGGSSLELIDPHADNRHPDNWRGSDESGKSEWLHVDYEDAVSNGDTTEFATLFVLANQAGEFLIDDVRMIPAGGGANMVPNGGFDSQLSPWAVNGNHWLSAREAVGGYGDNGGVLHVRAAGQGNVRSMATARRKQFDRVEVNLSPSPVKNDRYRIQAKIRWLAGWPFLRLSLGWYWMEALCEMPVPTNLGTPGMPNSHPATNTPPTVSDLQHAPLLPDPNEDVVVSCRILDPDGVDTPSLEYRNTSGSTYTTVPMKDDGLAPDTIADDGIYAALIPRQSSGTTIGFRLHVADSNSPPASVYYPSNDKMKDCLVRFGDPKPHAHLGHHTLWLSPENKNLLLTGDTKKNTLVDITWLYNGRRVAYNGALRWRGNGRQFNSSNWDKASYSIAIPKENRFTGGHEIKYDIPSRNAANGTFLQEHHGYWQCRQAGAAATQIRFVHLHVNGSELLRHDFEVSSREFCSYWYDDPDPHTFEHKAEEPLAKHVKTPTGDWNYAIYRHGMQKKLTKLPDTDYSVFHLIGDALTLGDQAVKTARLRALIDPYGFGAYFAGNRVSGNSDTYGWTNKHNGFAYASPSRRMRWHLVDLDGAFRSRTSLFPTQPPGDIFAIPRFRRAYLRILKSYADRSLDPDRGTPMLVAWHQALLDEGLTPVYPSAIITWNADKRTEIVNELAKHEAEFAFTSPAGSTTSQRIIDLDGAASYDVRTFQLNGRELRMTFPSTTQWESQIELAPGTNVLSLLGFDRADRLVASNQLVVTCTAQAVAPHDRIVINEIMYDPVRDSAEFVEIHNCSQNDAFDLGGWRLDGVSFTFDAGTILRPGDYCVVAEDRQIYAHTYTNSEAVVGDYDGSLDNGGETLRLLAPAGGGWTVVDKVRYDDDPPWPAASTNGCSLQLIDATEDNSRIGNWATSPATGAATPGTANSVAAVLPAFPLVRINEIMPSNTTSIVDNMGEHEPWIEILNGDNDTLQLGDDYYLSDDATNLTKWAFPADTALAADTRLVVYADGEPGETVPDWPHTSWRMNSTGGVVILAREYLGDVLVLDLLDYDLIDADYSYGSYPEGDPYARQVFHHPSPAGANCPTSQPVCLRINEWMADNDNFIVDPADGNDEDWFELYNYGDAPVNLGGFSLTDDSTSSNRFTIPGGYVLPAHGHLLVWADNDPEQCDGISLHTDFALSRGGEEIALYAPDGKLIDLVSFGPQSPSASEGCWPDGAAAVFAMAPPTPGASNRVLHISGLSLDNEEYSVTWQAESGRVYRLESIMSLSTGTWQQAGVVTADADVITLTHTNPIPPRIIYYRLRRQ